MTLLTNHNAVQILHLLCATTRSAFSESGALPQCLLLVCKVILCCCPHTRQDIARFVAWTRLAKVCRGDLCVLL